MDFAGQSAIPVIHVGPSPHAVGGMATVVRQITRLPLDGRYGPVLFPVTTRERMNEAPWQRLGRHVRNARQLACCIRENNAAIVHLHTCSGFSFWRSALDMFVAQRQGARVILHVHGAAFDQFHDRLPRIARRFVGRILRRADRVIALSQGWQNALRRMGGSDNITVIENAVALTKLVPRRCHDGPIRLAFLGRMDVWKGIDDLLDACTLLHGDGFPARTVLAGPSGTAGGAGRLAEKIRSRGLSRCVRYLNEVRGHAKRRLLRWADLYVQPSHWEGMPIALLEALSYGLPVVATSVGAVPEVIGHGRQGLLVAPHRPDLLAVAIRELAEDRRRRASMSAAARKLAEERFSLDRLRADLLRLYEHVRWPARTEPLTNPIKIATVSRILIPGDRTTPRQWTRQGPI